MEGERVFSQGTAEDALGKLIANDLTPEKAYELCRADFSPEAYQPYKPKGSGGPQLTTLKAHWIIERLSEVFGWHGWVHHWFDIVRHDQEVCATVRLSVMIGTACRTVYGTGSARWDVMKGDAIKSAITDGLTKAASYLGMGESMFKGEVNAQEMLEEAAKNKKKEASKEPMISAGQLTDIHQTMEALDNSGQFSAEGFYDWMSTMSGGKSRPEQLTEGEAETVISLLNRKMEEVK